MPLLPDLNLGWLGTLRDCPSFSHCFICFGVINVLRRICQDNNIYASKIIGKDGDTKGGKDWKHVCLCE